MGIYVNRGNRSFRDFVNDDYVDKTGLIRIINQTLNTERRFTCVTRSRRFGKSMAAKMLCAYYDQSCDSRKLFHGLQIENDPSFELHLNKYPVICIDISSFITKYRDDENIIWLLQQSVIKDLLNAYPTIQQEEADDLMDILLKIIEITNQKFIIIIDEWDALLREFNLAPKVQKSFIDLMRRLFKSQEGSDVFAGAYLTGILPIVRYDTQSALNNFEEYSMVDSADLAPYFGFTPQEVETLALKFNTDMDELRNWYDGYQIGNQKSIYNPYSVMKAVHRGNYKSYWTNTSAYDSVSTYIQLNYDGLKEDIIKMLGGQKCRVNTTKFSNDMHDIRSKDDVLTILIHLGYLAYNQESNCCFIPNKEVIIEFTNAIEGTHWNELIKIIEDSETLLSATLNGDETTVAHAIDRAHDEHTSILSYNNENSLACVLSIAYIYAHNDYIFHREYATGKGFADLVLIPRKSVNSPALVIELKFNNSANTAIDQIKRKQYPDKLSEYSGNILLVGISYNREKKEHACKIEKLTNS